MVKKRKTAGQQLPRVEVPGLIPGELYKRVVPFDEHAIVPNYTPEDGWPIVTYLHGAVEGHTNAGTGGWFQEIETGDGGGTKHFYLAEHVAHVTGAEALTEEERTAANCSKCDKKKYSQGLCTKHYGRARKLVKEDGLSWGEAKEEIEI